MHHPTLSPLAGALVFISLGLPSLGVIALLLPGLAVPLPASVAPGWRWATCTVRS